MGEGLPGQDDGLCLFGVDTFSFAVGILGTGPGFKTVMDLVADAKYQEYLPPMRLVAAAEPGPNPVKLDYLRRLGAPVYDSWREMLATHPEINLLIELAGGRLRVPELRAKIPGTVSLIDHNAAIFLCGMHNMHQVFVAFREDLDRRKAFLAAVLDELREDVLLLDRAGIVVDMNASVAQRVGKEKKELIGLPCFEVQSIVGGAPFCVASDPKCPALVTRAAGQKAEALLTRVDAEGRLLYYRVYSYPVFSAAGHLTHILVMRRDITARTNQEKALKERERLAVLGEMSMYLAHEIRNPICAIGGFTRALLGAPELSAKSLEKIKIIAEETQRLDSMLSSILKFTRPIKSSVSGVDTALLVTETLELMRLGYSAPGYTFQAEIGEDMPLAHCDPEVLKQCLTSLFKNAVEAMPEPGVITVKAGLSEDMVFVAVSDRGPGMTQRDIEKAFSPFQAVHGGEYGLDLALIKKAMEEIGGRIELKSLQGQGTTVTLFLPPLPGQAGEERAIVSI